MAESMSVVAWAKIPAQRVVLTAFSVLQAGSVYTIALTPGMQVSAALTVEAARAARAAVFIFFVVCKLDYKYLIRLP